MDRYQDAHMLVAKMQRVEIKSKSRGSRLITCMNVTIHRPFKCCIYFRISLFLQQKFNLIDYSKSNIYVKLLSFDEKLYNLKYYKSKLSATARSAKTRAFPQRLVTAQLVQVTSRVWSLTSFYPSVSSASSHGPACASHKQGLVINIFLPTRCVF